jgi:hypothetical protein
MNKIFHWSPNRIHSRAKLEHYPKRNTTTLGQNTSQNTNTNLQPQKEHNTKRPTNNPTKAQVSTKQTKHLNIGTTVTNKKQHRLNHAPNYISEHIITISADSI